MQHFFCRFIMPVLSLNIRFHILRQQPNVLVNIWLFLCRMQSLFYCFNHSLHTLPLIFYVICACYTQVMFQLLYTDKSFRHLNDRMEVFLFRILAILNAKHGQNQLQYTPCAYCMFHVKHPILFDSL